MKKIIATSALVSLVNMNASALDLHSIASIVTKGLQASINLVNSAKKILPTKHHDNWCDYIKDIDIDALFETAMGISALIFSAGNEEDKAGDYEISVKPYYTYTNQKSHGSLDAYKSHSLGSSLGLGYKFESGNIIRLKTVYFNTNVDTSGITTNDSKLVNKGFGVSLAGTIYFQDTYKFGIYGGLGKTYNTETLYNRFTADAKRTFATAKFDRFNLFAGGTLAKMIKFENDLTISPSIGMDCFYSQTPAYDEKGTGINNYHYSAQNLTAISARVSTSFEKPTTIAKQYTFIPKAFISYVYDTYATKPKYKFHYISDVNRTVFQHDLESGPKHNFNLGTSLELQNEAWETRLMIDWNKNKISDTIGASLRLRVHI